MPINSTISSILSSSQRSPGNIKQLANQLFSSGSKDAKSDGAFRIVGQISGSLQDQIDQLVNALRTSPTLSSPLTVVDPSGNVIAQLGDFYTGSPAQLSIGGWFKNLWIGGSGPSTAAISASGGSVSITGATFSLTDGGVTTTINGSGFEVTDGTVTLSVNGTQLQILVGSASITASASGLAIAGATFSLTDGGVTTTINSSGFSVTNGSVTFEITGSVVEFAGSTGSTQIASTGVLTVAQTGPLNSSTINGGIVEAGTNVWIGGSTGVNLQDSTASTATAGSASLPANPVGFWVIQIGGANAKIPYYAN